MTTALDHALLQISLPVGWYAMPDPDAPEALRWPYELVGRFGFQGRDALSAVLSLADALGRARAQARPKRLRWVFVGEPAVPVVQAWARLDVVPRVEPDAAVAADTYERGARDAGEGPESAVWHREVTRRTLHGDPAVLVHDLLTIGPEADASRTVQHRAVVAMFPAEGLLISLLVSTPLLAALPDLEATALEIAERVVIGDPR